jgi:hypothetical protein
MLKWWMPVGMPAVLALVGVVPILGSLSASVYPTRDKCAKVRPGMAEREALEVLGPGLERLFSVGDYPGGPHGYTTPDGFVMLHVDRGGRVTGCSFTPKLRTAWDRIWWSLTP